MKQQSWHGHPRPLGWLHYALTSDLYILLQGFRSKSQLGSVSGRLFCFFWTTRQQSSEFIRLFTTRFAAIRKPWKPFECSTDTRYFAKLSVSAFSPACRLYASSFSFLWPMLMQYVPWQLRPTWTLETSPIQTASGTLASAARWNAMESTSGSERRSWPFPIANGSRVRSSTHIQKNPCAARWQTRFGGFTLFTLPIWSDVPIHTHTYIYIHTYNPPWSKPYIIEDLGVRLYGQVGRPGFPIE